jgi:hypothetical protein
MTFALTPALSPRRGSVKDALALPVFVTAFIARWSAEKVSLPREVANAPPLLGERAGVRAD